MTTNRRNFLRQSAAMMAAVAVAEQGVASPSKDLINPEPNSTGELENASDAKSPANSRWRTPRAVADGGGGTIIATLEVSSTPHRIFRALTTDEIERWWGHPDVYRMQGWKADLGVCGQWSASVVFPNGKVNVSSGEFEEINAPHRLVMTRRFQDHPLLGKRETTITYRLDPVTDGTRITVRDEGFVGRSEAAYANAEHWEHVLDWLNAYLTSAT